MCIGGTTMNVCVYGAASQQIQEDYKKAAQELGSLMGKAGLGLVFGGGATGLMGACARGMEKVGGRIIGVAPHFFDEEGVLFPRCTEMIFTDTMRQRKEKMELLSEAFVMTPGGIGTMEEFFEILALKQLGRTQKPIAILNTMGYYDSLKGLLEHSVAHGFLEPGGLELFQMYNDPQELVEGLCRELGL